MAYVWPRTDADPSRWPSATKAGPSWHEQLKPNHQKYDLYQTKLGEHLFSVGLRPNAKPVLLPEGYALFGHYKPQGDGTIREDVYMFGSMIVLKFRSPNEFFKHAEWLFATDIALGDHQLCECKYNSQSALAQAKKSAPTVTPSGKRVSASATAGPSKRAKVAEDDDDELDDGWVAERSIDFRTGRRYRKGELVFFRIPAIQPPAGRALPAITHWPGLIADIATDVLPATETEPRTERMKHYVRPLGLLATASSASIPCLREEVLPFAVMTELYDGPAGWTAIGREGVAMLEAGVRAEVQAGAVGPQDAAWNNVQKMWKDKWGKREPFKQFLAGKTWEQVVIRLAMALKMARCIAGSWSQTDKITPGKRHAMSPEMLRDVESGAKTLYQGLWWGGERIWMDDMIRLRISGDQLPADMPRPAPDASVFLRIRILAVERTLSDPTKDTYRCMVYGDLHDIVQVPAPTTAPPPPSASLPPRWAVALPPPRPGNGGAEYAAKEQAPTIISPPPPGYRYRRLNQPDIEASADVLDIAGRVYGDLLDDWRANDIGVKKADGMDVDAAGAAGDVQGQLRELPEAVRTIMGLKSAKNSASRNNSVWQEDLYTIVDRAQREIEQKMQEHYAELLGRLLGLAPAPTPAAATPPVSGTNSASSAASAASASHAAVQVDVAPSDDVKPNGAAPVAPEPASYTNATDLLARLKNTSSAISGSSTPTRPQPAAAASQTGAAAGAASQQPSGSLPVPPSSAGGGNSPDPLALQGQPSAPSAPIA